MAQSEIENGGRSGGRAQVPEGKLKKYACQAVNQNNPRCD
jgi:hypothetical protein